MRTLHFPTLALVACCVTCVLATAAYAEEASKPVQSKVVYSDGPDASEGAKVPAVSPTPKPLRDTPLVLRTVPLLKDGDKGSMYVDGGLGKAMATPTSHEQMKLDAARRAVDAARATGVLFSMRRQEPKLVLSAEQLAEEKMRAYEKMMTMPRKGESVPGSPIATQSPVQLRGPEGLTDLERQKLEAAQRGETFVGPPVPPAKPEKPRVDQDRAREKGGR